MPPDLEASYLVDRFGAQAVFGSPASRRDLNGLHNARRAYDAYQGRKASGDWVEWAKAYPRENELLTSIMLQVADDNHNT